MRDQRRVVEHAEALGCRVATPEEAYRRDQEADVTDRDEWADRLLAPTPGSPTSARAARACW